MRREGGGDSTRVARAQSKPSAKKRTISGRTYTKKQILAGFAGEAARKRAERR